MSQELLSEQKTPTPLTQMGIVNGIKFGHVDNKGVGFTLFIAILNGQFSVFIDYGEIAEIVDYYKAQDLSFFINKACYVNCSADRIYSFGGLIKP